MTDRPICTKFQRESGAKGRIPFSAICLICRQSYKEHKAVESNSETIENTEDSVKSEALESSNSPPALSENSKVLATTRRTTDVELESPKFEPSELRELKNRGFHRINKPLREPNLSSDFWKKYDQLLAANGDL